MMECPSSTDPMKGLGNDAGRDCSGRGICDYTTGKCTCFTGFYGASCQTHVTNLVCKCKERGIHFVSYRRGREVEFILVLFKL